MGKMELLSVKDFSCIFPNTEMSSEKEKQGNERKRNYFLEYAEKYFSEASVFSLTKGKCELDFNEAPFAYYNYTDRNVWSGRWIGKTTFTHKDSKESVSIPLEIAPRFGTYSLFAMLEEAFSCNIVKNIGGLASEKQIDSIMKMILPFLWEKKLSAANRYGIPYATVNVVHKGASIKGRLNVQRSIAPLFHSKEVISVSREKQIDEPVAQIILQAYKRLKTWGFHAPLSDSSKNALDSFSAAHFSFRQISENDYQHIRYKSIYQSYKDIVDFSWQILKSGNFNNSDGNENSFTGFIDMAEVWELYLRSLLRKTFSDWHVVSYKDSSINVYDGAFWERLIIPDIILERGNDVVVLDAKWKKMRGKKTSVEKSDLDRSDFFQIHSYISYFKAQGKNVIAGGLLYPLDEDFSVKNNVSDALWGTDKGTAFFVDGVKIPDYSDSRNNEQDYETEYKKRFHAAEKDFIDRLREQIGAALGKKVQNSA